MVNLFPSITVRIVICHWQNKHIDCNDYDNDDGNSEIYDESSGNYLSVDLEFYDFVDEFDAQYSVQISATQTMIFTYVHPEDSHRSQIIVYS